MTAVLGRVPPAPSGRVSLAPDLGLVGMATGETPETLGYRSTRLILISLPP